ncbi:hypothetical protein IJT10_06210 [bacterium]|nr:hypothetical protein [bacterium]
MFMEMDEEITEVINSLTDMERSVLEGLEDFDLLRRLSVVLILKGWKPEDVTKLTMKQIKKYYDDCCNNDIIVFD